MIQIQGVDLLQRHDARHVEVEQGHRLVFPVGVGNGVGDFGKPRGGFASVSPVWVLELLGVVVIMAAVEEDADADAAVESRERET